MPYRHAYLWVLLLFPAVGLAFWPSYFARLQDVSWILHAHGITASLWITLLAVQSWSIHREARWLHKLSGRASLALFPLFWVSGLLIVRAMAAGFVAADNPFHTLFGARLTPVDVVASGGILALYYVALARRRAVLVHASAMLAIPLFLLPPIVVRLMQIGGPFAIRGPAEFYKFGWGLEASFGLSIVIALWLYSRRPKHAWPFLVVAGATILQSLAFETLGRSSAWLSIMPEIGRIPTWAIVAAGLLVSTAVVWRGWSAVGAPPRRSGELAEAVAVT